MNPDCRVRLSVVTPSRKYLAVEWMVSECIADVLDPLDRNHDFPLAVQERIDAQRKTDARRHIIKMLANDIAERMIKLIEEEDPRHGFTASEWKSMHE